MNMRTTYSVAEMPISQAAYDEIAGYLRNGGYDHAFMSNGMIDMDGIGLSVNPAAEPRAVATTDSAVADGPDEPSELDIETQFSPDIDDGKTLMVSVPSWLLHNLSAPAPGDADKRMAFNLWLDNLNPSIRAEMRAPTPLEVATPNMGFVTPERTNQHIMDLWHMCSLAHGADGEDQLVLNFVKNIFQTMQSPFQDRVRPWMFACFGPTISADCDERNHRFLEESIELVQACGCTASEAHQLVDYVFGRPVGEKKQEAGGVMVTLAALCLAQGMDMHEVGEVELTCIWGKVEQIRAKQAAKPKHSPLPEAPIYAISCVKPGQAARACASNCKCLTSQQLRSVGMIGGTVVDVVRIGENNGGPYDMKGGAA
jgi:hypothetical protein